MCGWCVGGGWVGGCVGGVWVVCGRICVSGERMQHPDAVVDADGIHDTVT